MARRLPSIRSGSLKQQAVDVIRRAIFTGRFQPGDYLRELHLAGELEISQPTVREALFELERDGLVTRQPNVGTRVTNLTNEEVRDMVDIRHQLEITAGLRAAPRLSADDFVELERLLETLGRAIAANDYHGAAHADLEFHRCIWKASGSRVLVQMLEQLTVPLFAFVSIVRQRGAEDLTRVVKAHQPIIDALRSRKPQKIREALSRHFEGSYSEFFDSGAGDCRDFRASRGRTKAAGR